MKDTTASGVMFNSVFGVTPGCTFDTGNGKNITVDDATIASGGRLKLNGAGSTSSKSWKIVTTSGGKLRFACTSANSGDTGRKYTIATETDTLFTSETGVVTSGYELYDYDIPEAGTYFLYSAVNGINFYYLDFTQKVALGDLIGFGISANAVNKDYLTGESFDSAGLQVYENYSSGGKVDMPNDKYTIDSSSFDSSQAGTYTIKVNYGSFPIQTFDVMVHEVSSIKAYTDPVMDGGSGSKKIKRTRLAYKTNEAVDTSNLVVKALTEDGYSKIIKPTTALPDTSTSGVKEVSLSYKNLERTYTDKYEVVVADPALLVKDGKMTYNVGVDSSITATGTVVEGLLSFKTIQEAHDFLMNSVLEDDLKSIIVAQGTYNEKLYIETSNLSLLAKDKANMPIVQYNVDSDDVDSNGTSWSTFGSSSSTIQNTATSFKAADIIFKNVKYTTMAEYNAGSGNQQACALVTRADGAVFSACTFDGFQDTLYINAGNPVFNACSISGMTDFIFGEADNAYFKDCTIACKNRGDDKNNGYLVAHKPTSKVPTVGFFFESCSISSEEGVVDGTISLARSWGANAKVSYANCAMDKGISKEAYPNASGNGKNCRYGEMSGNKPTSSDYEEYSNTGDGSLSSPVTGMKMMTQDDYNALVALANTTFALS